MARRHVNYGLEEKAEALVRGEFEHMDAQKQNRNHKVMDRVPGTRDVGEGEIVFMDDGTNRRMYTKLNGTLRYVALT